jgi:hypothetical protein
MEPGIRRYATRRALPILEIKLLEMPRGILAISVVTAFTMWTSHSARNFQ